MAHLRQEIPQALWHYTSFAGFKGIVESKTIWASEYRFLNDLEEFQHAKSLCMGLIEEQPEYAHLDFPARSTLRNAVRLAFGSGMMHEERLSLMVASFSEVGDQLGQWRGYAANSTGVSIGLDLRHLRPPSQLETTVTFAPCVYHETEKKTLLKGILQGYCDSMQTFWNSTIEGGHKLYRTDADAVWNHIRANSPDLHSRVVAGHTRLQWDFLRIGPLLKNASFSEEREWRLVLPRETVMLPTKYRLQFRIEKDTLVPFIAFPLLAARQEGPILCREVIVGPGSHESAVMGVSMFLLSQQIPLAARKSEIPYRPAG